MALIVEDGTGRADAESYVSVADADAFHSKRLNTAWTSLEDSVKEAHLRLATDFLVAMYRMRWAGYRVSSAQALDWPRFDVLRRDSHVAWEEYWPDNVVPPAVAQACAMLAAKSAAGVALAPDQKPLATHVQVGPVSKTYAPGTRQATWFRDVDMLLQSLLGTSLDSEVVRG